MPLLMTDTSRLRKAQSCLAITIVVFSAWLAPVCGSLCARFEPAAASACEACHHGGSPQQRPSGNEDCPKLVCARLESTVQPRQQDISAIGAVPLASVADVDVEAARDMGWSPHRSRGLGPPVPQSLYSVLRS